MSESRVDRLLRLAETAAMDGDSDRTESLLAVLSPAIYLRDQEIREMRRMTKAATDPANVIWESPK